MSSDALAAGIRNLRGRMSVQCRNDESDEQLLHAFTARRDEDAFAVLVRRHGPMVLHVCRRVLEQQHDAEDAFQAVFLLLAQSAADLRNKSSLAGFLHGAAYRIALTAKRSAARRRKHEGAIPGAAGSSINPVDELSWREVRMLLDEEIARLPEKYRTVFVLCHLENLSQAEAARRLGMKERTLSSRLTAARKRLSQRLARRGVEMTAVLAAIALAQQSASALPAGVMAATLKAAVATAAGEGLAGIVSASVTEMVQGVTSALALSKAKLAATVLLTASVLAGAGLWRTADVSGLVDTVPAGSRRPFATQQTPRKEQEDSRTVAGRVLDPDGKPAASAKVFVDPQTPDGKLLDSATTGKDGRFSFTLPRSRLVDPDTKLLLRTLTITATAKGCGLDWLDVPLDDAGKEVTLRLVKDDVPIQGRILSLEGKPRAGVEVSVQRIMAFPKHDLSSVLQKIRAGHMFWHQATEVRELRRPIAELSHAKTDADGRFRLDGIGRDRMVMLHCKGPGIHYDWIWAMTRPGEPVQDAKNRTTIYGAAFEYLARPSRLIRGTVRDKGSGKPLAGIHIISIDTTAQVRTDAQGRYELPGLPKADRYPLMAVADNGSPYFSAGVTVEDTPGLAPLAADVEMTRGIPCEGKVLDDPAGKPVPGRVQYYPLRPNPFVPDNYGLSSGSRAMMAPLSEGRVMADGSFHCSVLPGPGCLVFHADDPQCFRSACVDAGANGKEMGTKDLLYVLSMGGSTVSGLDQALCQAIVLIDPKRDEKKVVQTLRPAVDRPVNGVIWDPDGKPLTGVTMRDRETYYVYKDKTLATERFTVHGVNPLRPRRLHFTHEARHLLAAVEVKGTEAKPLIVQLQPWAAVRGRLLDADGRPLRDAEVSSSEFLLNGVRTDEEGRFRLEGLIPGLSYDLTFTCGKNKRAATGTLTKGLIAKPGEVRDLGDVRGQPARQDE